MSLILLAAGGTGGHIFPAKALAEELLARGREVALATDDRGEAYDRRFPGVEVHTIRAGTPSGKGPIGKVVAVADILRGVLQARRLIADLEPDLVAGFGGYPSLPTMWAAAGGDQPILLHEQNAVLGRVNRFLARKVDAIAVSFERVAGLPKKNAPPVVLVGNPVRAEIADVAGHSYEAPTPDGDFHLLIFGGSQGALVMGSVVPEAVRQLPDALRARLVVCQQCRDSDRDNVAQAYREMGVRAEVETFFEDMPERLRRAHLVIARAGAGTVSEIAVAGRPAILVPYSFATDDHQTANAGALVAAGGAWLMPHDDFMPEALAGRLVDLAERSFLLQQVARNALTAGRPDAARRLANLVDRLAPPPRGRNGNRRQAA